MFERRVTFPCGVKNYYVVSCFFEVVCAAVWNGSGFVYGSLHFLVVVDFLSTGDLGDNLVVVVVGELEEGEVGGNVDHGELLNGGELNSVPSVNLVCR